VSSKADDFDVRYRGAGENGYDHPGNGGYGGAVDYDLGYAANGWDTNGFRSPEAGYQDQEEAGQADRSGPNLASIGTAVRPGGEHAADGRHSDGRRSDGRDRALGSRRDGSHARPSGAHQAGPPQANGYRANGRPSGGYHDELDGGPPTQAMGATGWDLDSTGRAAFLAPQAPPQGAQGTRGARGRRGKGRGSGGPGGPPGPGTPGGPPGPDGLRGPARRGRNRPKVKGSWWRHWTLRKVLGLLLAIIGAAVVLGAIAVVVVYQETPVPTEAMAATAFSQSVVYSSNGTLIGRFGTTDRQMLTYNQLAQGHQWIIDAVLGIEDHNFYNEGGISPTGIIRAAYEDAKGNDGSLQGGSTITQEFVRQYYAGIGTQQTFSRKIKEIFVALKVAKEKSKPWILTNFLNTIYLGDGAYGVGAAAQTYYGEQVSQLTAGQAAVIAAIIQQPSTYPLPQYRPQLEVRWHAVLTGMVQMGDLTQAQASAMTFPAPKDYVPQSVGSDNWDPYVLDMVRNELEDVYHFSQSQLYNGGYVIHTTIDDAKMKALYAAVQANEIQMVSGGVPLPSDAQVGAVLEDPGTGAIEAMYPGPGYPGSTYVDHNGAKHTMTVKMCKLLHCEVNMAVYNREQVGSSFKPYVLATAVSQGMNVQTSTLNGFDPLWIPPDTMPSATFSTSAAPANAKALGYYQVNNDSPAENGPFTAQMAMAESINTAYTDLWHHVGGAAVANMAKLFGVNTTAAGITGPGGMENEAGIALGQASLTVSEQATMLATIDDGGVYHSAHVISSITQSNAQPTPIKVTSYPVFNSADATLNSDEATQVQYAMSEDTAPYGTAPTAALSNGQVIIAKTGTTTSFQSAFFIGAIPQQALAVGMFTDRSDEFLPSDLGGNSQGGYGGTWPASIWHTYAENEFVPMGLEQWPTPVFTGAKWNEVPPGLRVAPKKKVKKHGRTGNPTTGLPTSPGNPTPFPTYSCDPSQVTCGGPTGFGQSVSATRVGGAAGGIVAGLPATGLWVRRRMRKRGPGRG
jgi:membrane peptidoglycan carboxypeptidase